MWPDRFAVREGNATSRSAQLPLRPWLASPCRGGTFRLVASTTARPGSLVTPWSPRLGVAWWQQLQAPQAKGGVEDESKYRCGEPRGSRRRAGADGRRVAVTEADFWRARLWVPIAEAPVLLLLEPRCCLCERKHGVEQKDTRGVWLRGEDDAEAGQEDGSASAPPAMTPTPAPPVVESATMPSWNSSTMCVQLLRDAMAAQGWGEGEVVTIPMAENSEELPERPEDFGVGWWR
jgi:hypothetical protein